MAETFVAVRTGPGGFEQRVCLKRILPGRASDPKFVELFLDEARLLTRMSNSAIVQVYDFGKADGAYYMALELVDGMDLEALLQALQRRGRRLPWQLAVFIAVRILSALEYASTVQVDGQPLQLVHRDISPSNILLSMQGEVKLSDFGIAKAHGRTHKTATGMTKGKAAYMSPEQVRGEQLDGRSDLFAVGVVLYEMLAGLHPFDADTDLQLLNNILAGRCPLVRDHCAEVPQQVAELTHQLMQPTLSVRTRSPGDALVGLQLPEQAHLLQRQLGAAVSQLRAHAPQGPADVSAWAARVSTSVLTNERPQSSAFVPATSTAAAHGPARSAPPKSNAPVMVALGCSLGGAALAVLIWLAVGGKPAGPEPAAEVIQTPAARSSKTAAQNTLQPTAVQDRVEAASSMRPERESQPSRPAQVEPNGPDPWAKLREGEPSSRDRRRSRREREPESGSAWTPAGGSPAPRQAAPATNARSGVNVSTDDF
jgi:serine/threonine protein kinase